MEGKKTFEMAFVLQLSGWVRSPFGFLLSIPVTGCVSVFQKVVERELDALLEQQSSIESKMVTLHRMG